MSGVITASEPSWTAPFTGLSPRVLGQLVTAPRREGASSPGQGRPWGLPLEDRVLLVVAYWRMYLTMRQLVPWCGISQSAANRIIDQAGPLIAFRPRRRFAKDTVPVVDGTLVPARDHNTAEREHNRSYKQVRARVEHVFARMKTWKVLRDCRLKGDGVPHAMLGIARLHNLALTG
ncbi:transposase family protein [Streptomyces sp. I05A-00742]|uniref:helix-turn-helix domain-containing protein n=1 Tax=Streptomyces sp. I05A-00742 TaxID=2732853 RepID=UPI0014899439|nr:transposase family protein [Streptomyces sp. I05A-00742]